MNDKESQDIINVKVKLSLTLEEVVDVLCLGTYYSWFQLANLQDHTKDSNIVFVYSFEEPYDPQKFTREFLTKKELEEGLQFVADKSPGLITAIIDGSYDVSDADNILQLITFKEIVYS